MSNRKNRFLIPAYLWHTVKIKMMAASNSIIRNVAPYDYFKNKIRDTDLPKYNLKYIDKYHSLSYFDYGQALQYYKNHSSITVDIILALTYYNDNHEHDRLLSMAHNILAHGTEEGDSISFYINEDYDKFHLSGTYLSAIVQGKAASLFIKCYVITKDEYWLDKTKKVLNHFEKSVEKGGILRTLADGSMWMEEYPSPSPSMVLNGFLFWLIGLGEYCYHSGNEIFIHRFEAQLKSALNWLPSYYTKHGLLYSMYRWNECNVHYVAIMKYQFEHLYAMTGLSIFSDYADHCNSNFDWRVFEEISGIR